ncbi:hypothetical protein ElyMa_005524200 [Elysia marginata]|uniref:Secreted protein n=1 Tax=Elysia marginata TaxID=1093978 RepID=A0AAV4EVL3_9GAST|nr:hypothetical protein ElyMa_005524200 [Elysia marginata]
MRFLLSDAISVLGISSRVSVCARCVPAVAWLVYLFLLLVGPGDLPNFPNPPAPLSSAGILLPPQRRLPRVIRRRQGTSSFRGVWTLTGDSVLVLLSTLNKH